MLTLTAACGGSSDSGKGGDAAGAKALTAEQMKAGLLEASELPAGWTEDAAAGAGDKYKAEKAECQPLAALMGDEIEGATAGANREFSRASDSGIFAQQIYTYKDTAAATGFVKGVADAVASCATFTVGEGDEKMEIKAEKLETAKVGEESAAVRLITNIPQLGMKIESDVLVARQGAGLTRVAYAPMGAKPDHASFDDLAKRAGEKFVKGATS
ncbi:hypothetical protein [Streptomyces sp. TRM64462]|uniref:hypothetical protein n=1 Tax=Streptomyces sp. TRM64462 TaxID=2741726 RepID=UPI001586F72E|nr:hypothetical protein [Streptomyces sp. TRM64462]